MSTRWTERASRGVALLLLVSLGGCGTPALLGPEDAAPLPTSTAEPAAPALPPLVVEAQAMAAEALAGGEPEIAFAALDRALETHPNQPLLRLNRGIASYAMGESQAASADFLAVLEQHPGQPVAHNHLGMLARAEGDFDSAREHYQAALASDPQHALAHYNLGILCDLYLQQQDCALNHYEAYLQAVGDAGDNGKQIKQVQRWTKDLSRRLARAGGGS